MNKAFYILFFFFFNQNPAKSQNLIYNGDFEIYDTCPTNVSTPGDLQIEYCLGWTVPNLATSDFYNSCASWPVGVPSNTLGYQFPYSGNGYCGILIQNCTQPSCNGWWFEYLQSELISPLVSGVEYEFSCQIVMSNIFNEFAWSEFGAIFTTGTLSLNSSKPFQGQTPQAINQNYLSDTLNWINFRSNFIAQGGEKYVTIGFFVDTLNPDTLRFTQFPVDPNNFGTYYYIDNCSLTEFNNTVVIPNVFSPNEDELNEIFKIENAYGKTEMKIFNRWGELIYFAEGRNCYWDGRTYAGVECPEGVYYYSIKIEEKEFKGFVHLLR